jgi:hypothetical protein
MSIESDNFYDELTLMPIAEPHVERRDAAGKGYLYTVTPITIGREGNTSTFVAGICTSFREAARWVEKYGESLWEHYYNCLVIEAVQANASNGGFLCHEYWYRWNHKERRYEPIVRPERFKGVVAFWQ